MLVALLLAVTCTGCSATQLHERLIVQGIGVDRADGAYLITLQVFDAINAGEEGDSSEPQVVSAMGKSVLDAFNELTRQTGKEPLLSQNLVLVIGEEAAKEGVSQLMDFFIRYYECRPEVDIFLAEESAVQVLSHKVEDKLVSAQNIDALSHSGELNAGSTQSTVLQVVQALQSETTDPSMQVLSFQEQGEKTLLTANGTALFQGDRLAGYLNAEETEGMMLVTGEALGGTEVIQLPDVGSLTFALMGSGSKTSVTLENGKPKFTIDVTVKANLYEVDRTAQDKLPHDSFDQMTQALEQRLQALCEQSIHRAVYGYHSDVFRFGRKLWKAQPDYYRQMGEWEDMMTACSYEVHVNAEVKRVGQEANPL